MNNKKLIFTIIISFIVDRITKVLIGLNYNLLETKPIINNLFSITYVKNKGAAFSILENKIPILIIISILAIILLVYYLNKEKNISMLSTFSYGIIIGGILGNLFDRVFLNGVVDFLSFKIFDYYFPIFNIADSLIVIGIIILIIEIIINDIRKWKDGYQKDNSRRK